jgi:hypothetical protein
MRVRLLTPALLCFAMLLVWVAPSGAATQLGTKCAAASLAPALIAEPGLGTAAANGLITKWGIGFAGGGGYTGELVLLAPNGVNSWTVQHVTGLLPLVVGDNATTAHIQIKTGQLIAYYGTPGAAACTSGISNSLLTAGPGSLSMGTVVTTSSTSTTYTVPLWADVEPDVDGDNFGDETQDLCPQSAALQIACPNPKLAAELAGTTKSFQAWVTTDVPGKVTATGSVKLPGKSKPVTFTSTIYDASPGVLTKVTLKYPKALTSALAKLSKKKTLKVTVNLTADGVLGDSTKTFTVKLRGKK